MDTEKILLHEMDTLRAELQHLKNCQVRYFLFSITMTGTVIALVTKYSAGYTAAYLAPLVVVIPCWWIFFDKASTITRIVGYYRVLEKMILSTGRHWYIGWENALAEFRKWPSIRIAHREADRTSFHWSRCIGFAKRVDLDRDANDK